jgi:hypothetical protein
MLKTRATPQTIIKINDVKIDGRGRTYHGLLQLRPYVEKLVVPANLLTRAANTTGTPTATTSATTTKGALPFQQAVLLSSLPQACLGKPFVFCFSKSNSCCHLKRGVSQRDGFAFAPQSLLLRKHPHHS